MAKNGMLYDPMLRLCITYAWAWKKTSRIKQKITIKINFEMGSNLLKLQKKMVLQKLYDTTFKNQI